MSFFDLRRAACAALAGLAFAGISAIALAAQPAKRTAPAATAQSSATLAVAPVVYRERRLGNGLQVITVESHPSPTVSVQVWYHVGSRDDPAGRSGFAHLFEHMMFKSSANLRAEQFDRLTEDVGGANNASTGDDVTEYHEVVPSNHLETLLWAEAERMANLKVDDANFKSERAVVEEEYRQRVLASPYGRLFNAFSSASYLEHPYKRPGIGNIDDLEAATLADVVSFHARYYRPDNATLVVAGDFDAAQLDAWIDKYFGALKNPPQPIRRVVAVEPPRRGPGVYDGYGPNVPLPALAITWLGPKASDPDAPALKVLDAILSGGKSSRLYNSLVYDKQIAAEAFSSADMPAQPGMFAVGAIMATGHDLAVGETALLAEVKRLRDAPPTAAELSEAKNELVAGKLRERETIDGRGFALGYALRIDGDAAKANTALADLQAVTAADVQRVVRKYLTGAPAVTIEYAQAPAAQGSAK